MSLFTGIAPETLQARLTAAQTALLDLEAGALAVSVRASDGKSVTFTPADSERLRRHIRELQAALGQTSRVTGVYIAGGKGL